MSANRFNIGKLRWDLIDWESVEEMLKVLESGAIKYDQNNWKKGLHREETLESTQRHLIELFKKRELDSESTLHHMGHIMCNAMFYLYHHRNNSFTKQRNNPFKKESPQELSGV